MMAVASLLLGACQMGASEVAVPAPATATAPATGAPEPTEGHESWYGVYLQGQKIGYLQESLRRVPDEPDRWEYTSSDLVDLNLLGQPLRQSTLTRVVSDDSFRPLSFDFELSSGGRSTTVRATVEGATIEYRRSGGEGDGGAATGALIVPEGAELTADARLVLLREKVGPGDELTFTTFNPVTLGLDTNELRCERRETLALPGETITDAAVVTIKTKYGTMTSWLDADGRPRKTEVAMMQAKLSYLDEPRDQALALEGGQRIDLATATAIRPDRPIADPRKVTRLVVEVAGLDALESVPSDGAQTVGAARDGWRKVTVLSEPPAAPKALTAAELAPYLAATPYIQSEHPDLIAGAKVAVTDDTGDAKERAVRIQRYVQQRVRWQSNVGMFRSALEVWRDPNGVCRDAAALYTALARADGLPTRVCGGLIYLNGAFLGHAWAETWIGDRWWPVDATMVTSPPDAARLKLAQGDDYTALFDMLPALGNLRVKVLEEEVVP